MQRQHRKAYRRQIQRYDEIVRHHIAQQVDAETSHTGQHGGTGHRPKDRTANGAAQIIVLASRLVLGDETDDAGLEAEAGNPAQNDGGNPDRDEDAVFIVAQPARHQHLADIRDCSACHADREGKQRGALRHLAVTLS